MMTEKRFPTVGCCGIDCGLCPRYYTEGNSKCPGCFGNNFADKHPSCSFVTCCVKKNNLEVCGQCAEYPCSKTDKDTGLTDSFVTHRKVPANLRFIHEKGLKTFLDEQEKRIRILETLLNDYDDGSSKGFYCLSCTLLSIESLNGALSIISPSADKKKVSKKMREYLNASAEKENVELKLRKVK